MNRRTLLSILTSGLAAMLLPKSSSAQTEIPRLGEPWPKGWKIDESATVFDAQSPKWDRVPRRVFDARLIELHKVIRCNTETGEVERFKRHASGELEWEFVIGFGTMPAKERFTALAPLIVLRPEEQSSG